MNDVESKVRDVLREKLDVIERPLAGADLTGRIRKRRAVNGALWVTGVCVAVLGVVGVWRALDPVGMRRDTGPVDTPGYSAAEIEAALSSIEPGWSRLPDSPFAMYGAHGVWTGQSLVVLGGQTYDGFPSREIAAYDPVDRSWERLPDAPVAPASTPVWTRDEILVWGPDGGAALDPTSMSWRRLPEAPAGYGNHSPSATVWTGAEMIVWGETERTSDVTNGAAYDPVANSWRTIASAPFPLNSAEAVWTDLSVWDDKEMFVFGSHLDGRNIADSRYARALSYDPDEDRWREVSLPAAGASSDSNVSSSLLSAQASSASWTGTHVLLWDYDFSAIMYDPFEKMWVSIDRVPFEFSECYPSSAAGGTKVLAWFCGEAALFDSEGFTWTKLDPPDGLEARPTAIGDTFFLPGASLTPGASLDEQGVPLFYAYKPPTT